MEPSLGLLMQRWRLKRLPAVALVALVVWLLGAWVALSFNFNSGEHWFGNWNFFQFLDWFTAALLSPLVSLATAIFVGWRMHPRLLRHYLGGSSGLFFWRWHLLLRLVVPPAIVVMLFLALQVVETAH